MIINLISSPRTVSTSLMYSFDNRADTIGVDEPYYAYYLHQTNKSHPGGDRVMEEMSRFPEDILTQINTLATEYEFVFVKNMGHHIFDRPAEEFVDFKNVILIRDPRRIVKSIFKILPRPTLLDIAVERQWHFFNELVRLGQKPIVVDSTHILNEPKSVLSRLCDQLGMPFDPAMLSWKAGARPIDGSWADVWYANTHKSTGFAKYKEKEVFLSKQENELWQEAKPYYDQLSSYTE